MNTHEILESLWNDIKIKKDVDDCGRTGYLDYLTNDDQPEESPVAKGVDPKGRKLIALWATLEINGELHGRECIVIHKRYTNSSSHIWVTAGNYAADVLSPSAIDEDCAKDIKTLIEDRRVVINRETWMGDREYIFTLV